MMKGILCALQIESISHTFLHEPSSILLRKIHKSARQSLNIDIHPALKRSSFLSTSISLCRSSLHCKDCGGACWPFMRSHEAATCLSGHWHIIFK